MSLDSTARTEAFLAEYGDLVRRHGIAITGCGCCGSPFLTDVKPARRRRGRTLGEVAERLVTHLRREGLQ